MSKNGQMSKNGKRTGARADPSKLQSTDQDDDAIIQVVIETPKGSRNKYAFDEEQKVFALTKVLPAGMTFPYDFGFIPSTKAEDGDPTDAHSNVVSSASSKANRARRKRASATIASSPSRK